MWALSVTGPPDFMVQELMEEIALNYRNGEGYLRDGILEALLQKGCEGFVHVNYLVSFFGVSGFSQKRFILKKLGECLKLARDCIPGLVENLAAPEPQLALVLLRVIGRSGVKHPRVKKWVEKRAASGDADVSRAAKECIVYLDTH